MADLRLKLIFDLANKATAPLKAISRGSSEAAQALKQTRDQLKQLDKQQADIAAYRKSAIEVRRKSNEIQALQERVAKASAALKQQRSATEQNTTAIQRNEAALRRAKQALEDATRYQQLAQERMTSYKRRLDEAGIGTDKLSQRTKELRGQQQQLNQTLDAQKRKLSEVAAQQKKLEDLRQRNTQGMTRAAMLAGAGMAGMAAGRGMAAPVGASLGAYGDQESATAQLRASMMLANGSVSAEFAAINELANRLGDRLPGTTADFINMMTMLRRQGLGAQNILGGTGEAAAYLAVQLRMLPTEAAEFAAKMQDATQTTESDMMGLMDLIQRTFYLGVDSSNMLQGFTKVGAAMSIIHDKGLTAAKTLAPLLVMMDQAGMSGEPAGNALRKVFQLSLDEKKLGHANKLLQGMGAGFQLNFANKAGKFAGLENLYAQLDKIKGIQSDVKRISLLKTLFGDDAETHQVLGVMMDKGLTGYREVADKLQAQADLRTRVNDQLKTLTNVRDAAVGSFTNVLAALGGTIAEDAKGIIDWLGSAAASTRSWIEQHPTLVGWLLKSLAAVAALTFVMGTLMVIIASVVGPLMMGRFIFGLLQLSRFASMASTGLRLLGSAGMFIGQAFMATMRIIGSIGMFLWANPIIGAIALIAGAAYLIYRNWDGIRGWAIAIWASITNTFTAGLAYITGLRDRAFQAGADLITGVANGITGTLGTVKLAIGDAADATIGWFKEKLGIRSPSRVFAEAGRQIPIGAAQGILSQTSAVQRAMAAITLATAAAPMTAGAAPLRIDTRPPLLAASTAAAAGGSSTYNITINAAPGQDPQAIARAVAAELDRRDAARRARSASALTDY